MRFLIMLLSIIWAAPASAQSRSPALAGLEAEFVGKSFTTKIPVGIDYVYSYQSQYQYQRFNGQFMKRGVETRVSSDGRIYYMAVGMHFPLQSGGLQLTNTEAVVINPNEMIPPLACAWLGPGQFVSRQCNQMNLAIPRGTSVAVSKWQWGNDAINLELSVGLGTPTIRFIFGKDFQRSATRESILSIISRALILEDFEHLQRTETEYPDLRRRLDVARSAYESAAGGERLQAGVQLQLQLRAVAQNRSQKLSHSAGADESLQYSKEAADLEPILNQLRIEVEAGQRRLTEEGRIKRVEALRRTYDAIVEEAKQLRAKAGSQPARTLADWKQQGEALTQWEASVRERTKVREQVLSEGESAEAFDAEAELKAIESRRGAIVQDLQRIELAQLNADFKELERRKIALLDAYTRTFGTPAQRDSASKLIEHLRTMLANRMAAQKAGQTVAAGQIGEINKELERVRR